MVVRYFKEFSKLLNRDMEYKTYGDSGIVFFYFPSQYQRFYEVEDQGIVSLLYPFIESKQMMIVSVDSIDKESLSNTYFWDKKKRLALQEKYCDYFYFELYPKIVSQYKAEILPVTFGMSFGGYQAMNLFLRRPKLFSGTFCLSGIYKIDFFINDYYDQIAFLNSPIDSINMLTNKDIVDTYNTKKILMVVSTGAYEEDSYNQTKELDESFYKKSIDHQAYYWSDNYPHDWSSWKTYLNFYLPEFIQSLKG